MYGSEYNPTNSPVPPVPFSQPTNLFRFGEQSIWSSQFLKIGSIANSQERLFSTAIGGTGGGFGAPLSIAETNIKEGGRVPSGSAYDVYGVACQVQGAKTADGKTTISQALNTDADIADLLSVIQNGVLVWDFLQTQIVIAPVIMCGAGGGAFGAVAAAGPALAQSGHMNNGNGQIWMYRKHPVALPGSATFNVLLQFGSRAADLTQELSVRVALLGYYKNVIEIG
jgi:hypothetical protein